MATAITVQNVSYIGADVAFVNADPTGNYFSNDGAVFLFVLNNSSLVSTISIGTARQCDQGLTHSYNVSFEPKEERFIGYFAKDRFNDTNGNINITTTNSAEVKLAAIKVVTI